MNVLNTVIASVFVVQRSVETEHPAQEQRHPAEACSTLGTCFVMTQ